MTWLLEIILPILESFGAWLVGILTTDLLTWAKSLITQWQKDKQATAVTTVDVAADAAATASGDENAIAQAGENLLNGTNTPPK